MNHDSWARRHVNSVTTITFNGSTYTCPFIGAVPRLTAEEQKELEADISAPGVVVPVVVTDAGEVIDGHNRLTIAAALGLKEIPLKIVTGLTAEQKQELAVDLNLHRRQLTRSQKNELIKRKLKADPSRSNNAIALEAGVSDKTVGATRKKMEATSEIPESDQRRGRDGRVRSVVRSETPAEPSPATPTPGRIGGRGRGPYSWWPELASVAFETECVAKELRSLGRTKTADRTLPPVQKIAGQLRHLVDRLDQMVASDEGKPLRKDA